MTAGIVIRNATAADAEALWRINRDTLGYRYKLEDTRRQLGELAARPGHFIAVAQLGEDVVGYIHAADYEGIYFPPLKNIVALAVNPAAQKNGAGRALLAAAEQWAKDCGAAGVRLNSSEARTGAHAFYERCGYKSEKSQKNYKKMFAAGEGMMP